jgi:hypothetical protein
MTADTAIERAEGTNPRTPWILVLIFVAAPTLLNAIALFPEVRYSGPYQNDQVFHYVFIERANQAISAGDNPFDHWLPELELGFPQFLYYQNLPHLTVVGLYRLFLKQISLIRLLNLIRYLLLVTFPLTVYWSMRRMEFSPVAAAVGAAFSPVLSSRMEYGFDFNSYVWRGFGMFPQLCSMHLMFIGTACVRRVLERGQNYVSAILATSAMILSDLLYGYIFGIVIALLWLLSVLKRPRLAGGLKGIIHGIGRSTVRLVLVVVPVGLITAYQTVPFLAQAQYINLADPVRMRHASLRGSNLWSGLLGGSFFDNNRLPVVTAMVIIGIFYCLVIRREDAKLALTMLIAWPILFMPSPIRSGISIILPLVHMVPFQRFVSGIDFGAILTAGLSGEFIWRCFRSRSAALRVVAPIALLALVYSPAVAERWNFYQTSTEEMRLSAQELQDDQELPQIMAALKTASPGRVYAGSRFNWGAWMRIGSAHLFDLLPTAEFATVMPWQTLSLNGPLLWQVSTPSLQLCRLFNIRYIVAPPTLSPREGYHPILRTSRYVLYEVDSGGYVQLGRVVRVMPMGSSEKLFAYNSEWLRSEEPGLGEFTAFLHPGEASYPDRANLLDPPASSDGSQQLGTIEDEAVTPDSFSARVTASSSAIVVLKTTYHPNWHVTVDGHEQPAFMVSPSFIATRIEPGRHEIKAEYRSSRLKKILLVAAGISLFATMGFGILGFGRKLFP